MQGILDSSYYEARYRAEFGSNMYIDDGTELIDYPIDEAIELAERFNGKSNSELMTALCNDHCYQKINDESQQRITSLALNFAVNQRQLIAPFFRTNQRTSFKKHDEKVYKRIEVIYSRDRQLIDLHWWCCRARSLGLENVTLGKVTLMTAEGIDPDGLVDAVMTGWSGQQKAETLTIPEQEQVLMRTIRTKTARSLQSYVQRYANKAKTKLLTYCTASPQLKLIDADRMYEDLLALRLSNQVIKHAVQIKAMMRGEPIPASKLPSAKVQMGKSRTRFLNKKLGLLKSKK